jgi:hypothetical protein
VNGVKKETLSSAEYSNIWISFDVTCSVGDLVSLYAKKSSNYATKASYWLACTDWDNGVAYNKVVSDENYFYTSATSMRASGIYVIIPTTATYNFSFTAERDSTSGTYTAQLYKNGKAISGATATWSSKNGTYSGQIACNAGDRFEIYGKSRGSSYTLTINSLSAEEVY